MKKRALAILMILVVATTGLFAALTLPTGAVEATLTAVVGEYLDHGFVAGTSIDANTTIFSSIEVNDAFNATTPPSFNYGYRTNAESGTYTFKMTVGNFTNGSGGTVLIKEVTSNKAISNVNNVYTVLTYTPSVTGAFNSDLVKITIKPFISFSASETDINSTAVLATNTAQGAPEGTYTATISFSVTAS